ncbi:MAG: DUF1800 domain-containing protein [Bacteroidota bacterium]|nr:DUF1800 domain-containing protein [Bacteroidota bacterium]
MSSTSTNIAAPGGALQPYTGPFGKKQLLHLLRRTLFGVSQSDLKHFEGKSLNEVVDELLNISSIAPPPPIRAYSGLNVSGIDPNVALGETWVGVPANTQPSPEPPRRQSYKQWWIGLMINQERSLREKLVLFWHNHLVTDTNDVVGRSQLAYEYNILLRSSCIANFRKLMYDITLDKAMLVYLNGQRNTVAAPDENYARELLELFTCGKGPESTYTEDDVKAAAKILTGWRVNRTSGIVTFSPNQHDNTPKKFSAFFGNTSIAPGTGQVELNALLDMIFAINEPSKFLCRKLFYFFLYYELNPEVEANLITPLAEIFRTSNTPGPVTINGYDIKATLKAFFTSDYFFRDEFMGVMIKSPADYNVGVARSFELAFPTNTNAFEARYFFWNQFLVSMVNAGQAIGDPPNVAGWPAYYQIPQFHEIWVDTATYPVREQFYESLGVNGYMTNARQIALNESKNQKIKLDYVKFVKGLNNPSQPGDLINESIELLFGSDVSQTIKGKLKTDFLLKGQTSDYYWTDAYNAYIADPNTMDPEAKEVPKMLETFFQYLFTAAEFHLH